MSRFISFKSWFVQDETLLYSEACFPNKRAQSNWSESIMCKQEKQGDAQQKLAR